MKRDYDLMLRAAWAHYIEGRTQEAVAQELGLTRAKTNRLIAECRDLGYVRIGIATEARLALREESELKKKFGLLDVWVIPQAGDPETAIRSVGIGAGAYISEHLGADETLALGWGRTVSASVSGLQPRKSQGNRVVTLLGSMVRGNGLNSFDIASRYARTLSAECCYLIAPRIADSAETAQYLLSQPYVQEALAIAAKADMALIGVDDLSVHSTLFQSGQISEENHAKLRAQGVQCVFQGVALDAAGDIIIDPIARRTVTLSPEDFKKIPRRILTASGDRKAKSISAILKGGHCNILITDEQTALEVLSLD